jgi:polyphosphate kinase
MRDRLDEILTINLADDTLAWELDVDGGWRRVPRTAGVNTHRQLEELAVQRARAIEARA